MVPRRGEAARLALAARFKLRRITGSAEESLGQLQRKRPLADSFMPDEQVGRRQSTGRERAAELLDDGVVTLNGLPHGVFRGRLC